jgi:RNA polymerase sigma-70 factor (ECF subfamily)
MTPAFSTQPHISSAAPTFDDVVLPHLAAAHRLASWIMRNDADAEDAVQDALLRALRYFRTFAGGNGRAWFLRIVRNTCFMWRGRAVCAPPDPFDEEQHAGDAPPSDPETLLLRSRDVTLLERAMSRLPDRSRELLVLRELEGFSYRELADVAGIPMGTVMSSLSRARRALRTALENERDHAAGSNQEEPSAVSRRTQTRSPIRPSTESRMSIRGRFVRDRSSAADGGR